MNLEDISSILSTITLGPDTTAEDGTTEVLLSLAGTVPPIVYHYTSAEGIEGIITKRELWASHANFLNDTTELSYGVNLCCEELRRAKGPSSAPNIFEAVATGVEMMARVDSDMGFDVYVVCFSDGDDILPQWKGYGASGAGFALGFDFVKVAVATDADPLRVIYNESQQRALIQAIAAGYSGVLERSLIANPKETERTSENLYLTLSSLIVRLTTCFKDARFSHENEWRLVTNVHKRRPQATTGVNFRAAHGVIMPYWVLSMKKPGEPLPITEVRCGPTNTHTGVMQGIEMFLRARGLKATVTKSDAPFRTPSQL